MNENHPDFIGPRRPTFIDMVRQLGYLPKADSSRPVGVTPEEWLAAHTPKPARAMSDAELLRMQEADDRLRRYPQGCPAAAAGDVLRQALEALEAAQPIMKHYTEPNERHQRAIEAVRAALASSPVAGKPTDADIRAVFLAHGFTVKEGQADLKPYVYEAARALLRAYAAPQASEAVRPTLAVPKCRGPLCGPKHHHPLCRQNADAEGDRYEDLEREHLGDADKGTGIYHPDNQRAPVTLATMLLWLKRRMTWDMVSIPGAEVARLVGEIEALQRGQHDAGIEDRARQLVADAAASGQVVRIDLLPRQPLAMGNLDMVVDVRPARHGLPSCRS